MPEQQPENKPEVAKESSEIQVEEAREIANKLVKAWGNCDIRIPDGTHTYRFEESSSFSGRYINPSPNTWRSKIDPLDGTNYNLSVTKIEDNPFAGEDEAKSHKGTPIAKLTFVVEKRNDGSFVIALRSESYAPGKDSTSKRVALIQYDGKTLTSTNPAILKQKAEELIALL